MTDNLDPTPDERDKAFYSHPFTRAYGIQPEEEAVPEERPLLPGFIMVTPAADGYDPYIINVATVQLIGPCKPHSGPQGTAKTCINFDAENYELVEESFEEVLLLMAAALS